MYLNDIKYIFGWCYPKSVKNLIFKKKKKKLIIIKTMFIIYVNWVWLVHCKAHNNNNNNNNILFLFLRKEKDKKKLG